MILRIIGPLVYTHTLDMHATSSDPSDPSPQIKPQYSGGDSVFREVWPLEASSFKALCTCYLLTPVLISLTRDAYWALPTKDARDAYKTDLPFFTAGFHPVKGRRRKADIVHCSLITLDIDDSDDARKLVEPGVLAGLLPFNHFAYHTTSSTPEEPRIRIVVDVDPILKEDYPAASNRVCDLLEINTRNAETLDCSRPMFRPSVFLLPGQSASKYEDAPIISVRMDGTPMPAMVPAPTGDHRVPDDGDIADMGNMRPAGADAPIPGLTRETIEGMLQHISPDCSRKDWMEVCCGLKHQFADDLATGFDIFNEWSMGAEEKGKYEGIHKTRYIWDSYKVTPAGGGRPKTMRTVRRMAENNGWVGIEGSGDAINRLLEAIQAASTLTLLSSTLLKEVALDAALGSVERATLVQAIQNRIKAIGHKVGLPDLKKEVARLRQEAAKEARSAEQTLPVWLAGWAYVTNMHAMFRLSDPNEGIKLDAFDMEQAIPCRDSGASDDSDPSDIAKYHPSFPKAAKQDYNPERPHDGFYEEAGLLIMNVYRHSCPPMDPAGAAEAGSILTEHMARNFPDPRDQAIFLSNLAYMVQCPGKKIRWGVFVQGVQGCGKSIIAEMMRAVMGPTNVNVVDKAMLTSSFNDWAWGYQLLVFDEILTGSDKKEIMDKLKPIITQDVIALSRKFLKSSNVTNRANTLFLSNYDEGIRIDAGERRYFVLKSAFQTKAQVETLPEGYFDRLFTLAGHRAGAIRQFLMNYPLHPEFDPNGIAPWSADRDKIISTSLNEVDYTVLEVIREGNYSLIQPDLVSSSALLPLARQRVGSRLSDKSLAAALTRLGFVSQGQTRIDGDRQMIWAHSSFSDVIDRSPAEVARDRYQDFRSGGFEEA